MSLPTTKLDICNLALGRIGAKILTSAQLTADTDTRAQHCSRNYEQTRDALQNAHKWRFILDRATLVKGATPAGDEWDHSYKLPEDLLLFRYIIDANQADHKFRGEYEIEGNLILTNEDEVTIKYVKNVTDITKFDALFIETLVLSLALKIVMPLTQDRKLYAEIKQELYKEVLTKVRTLNLQETNTTTGVKWKDAKY